MESPVDSPDNEGRGARRHRLRRLLAWGAAAVVVVVVAGFFAVPPLARHLLVARLGEALHRPVAVGAVRFNPLRLSLMVEGFRIGEREGAGEFLAFDELFADLEAVSILHRAPVLRELRLRGPRVHLVRREDGRTYNFSDLLERGGRPEAGKATSRGGRPARFAVHNIRLEGGRIEFEDRPRGARHEVADLALTLPFVSNFPARVDVFEQPALSAVVNGAPFRLAGRTKPFKDTRETVIELDLQGVDLPRYLAYLPADLGLTVREGTLGTKLSVSFSLSPEGRSLVVAGSARLENVAVAQSGGAPLLSLASLEVPAFTADVFGRRIDVEQVALQSPEVTVTREAGGGLNWASLLPAREEPPPADTAPWQVTVREARLGDGRLHWRDEAVGGGFAAEVEGVEAGVRAFSLPQREPAQVELKLRTGFGESLAHRGSLLLSPLRWEGDLEVLRVRPRAWDAYYREALAPEIRDGVLDAAARVTLAAQEGGTAISFTGFKGRLEGLKARRRGQPQDFLSLAALEVTGAEFDLRGRRLSLGDVALRRGHVGLVRTAAGKVALGVPEPAGPEEGGRGAPGGPEAPPPPGREGAAPPPPAGGERRWLVEAASVILDDCGASLVDVALPERPTHTVAPLSAEVVGLSTKDGSRATIRLTAGINRGGALSAKGEVGMVPLAARVDLELKGLALVPWYPYFADRVNFVTGSGELAGKGVVTVAGDAEEGTKVGFRGEAGVRDFVAVDPLNQEEMLTWKSLALGEVALEAPPFSLAIGEAVLSEFYARLIIFPDGTFNLREAVSAEGGGAPADEGHEPESPPAGRATPGAPAGAQKAGATVTIDRFTLQGGAVNFSDRFIKPNYSAVLTDLAGSVAGLSSDAGTAADLELRGRLNRSAPLSVSGRINPLAGDLFLDVRAGVRDIELEALTPYAARYLGHGIEKGKLSFDVAYRVEDRALSAENKLVLDQLTFGPKIESPDATSLPVTLAVALLKDRRGVIDVNLPIGGSLDDPQFSVGRIILRIVLNLIAKAVTSPFALLGAVFGGGEELSFAPFEAGSEAPLPEGLKRIEALRTALAERPGLRLEIAGAADPVADRQSLRRRRFEQQLKAQKLKDTARRGEGAPSLDAVVIEPAEYEKYLRRAYREAKFPRPRNFLGMLKELPLADTESLLLTNTPVTDDDLVVLANRRAQAAKDLLTAGEGVAPERVFLVAPVVAAAGPESERPAARVDFALK